MTLKMLKILNEISRTTCHYINHTNSYIADNMQADLAGEDIPFNGVDFKELSRRYNRQFDRIKAELDNELVAEAIVLSEDQKDETKQGN